MATTATRLTPPLVAIACAVTVPITAVTGMTTEASPNWIGDQPRTSWAYWVRMNGTPKAIVPSAKSTRLPPTSDRDRNTPSGASGATERDSMRDEDRGQDGRQRQQAQRLAVAPAGVRGLDDRVDQRHQRGRDRHRAGDVEAPLPGRPAALAQEHRAEGGHRRRPRAR